MVGGPPRRAAGRSPAREIATGGIACQVPTRGRPEEGRVASGHVSGERNPKGFGTGMKRKEAATGPPAPCSDASGGSRRCGRATSARTGLRGEGRPKALDLSLPALRADRPRLGIRALGEHLKYLPAGQALIFEKRQRADLLFNLWPCVVASDHRRMGAIYGEYTRKTAKLQV